MVGNFQKGIRRGRYTTRKALTVYYNVAKGYREVVAIVGQGERNPDFGSVISLPSLEVTPSTFKHFVDLKQGKPSPI